MSIATAGDPDRIGSKPARPSAKPQPRRGWDIVIPASVLMLMMLGGLGLRALLAFGQGMH